MKTVKERIKNVEEAYKEALSNFHGWIQGHDEDTLQAFWRCVFFGGPESLCSEFRDRLTGGAADLLNGDWEIVRSMYKQAPQHIIENIKMYKMPHPRGVYGDDIYTD